MITIKKLCTLKEKTRLRKISLILEDLEIKLVLGNFFDRDYYLELFHFLVNATYLEGTLIDLQDQMKSISVARCEASLAREEKKKFEKLARCVSSLRYKLKEHLGQSVADWDFYKIDGQLQSRKRSIYPMQVYLEDIRSPFNVGSIFRSSEAFGVSHIYMSLDTPAVTHHRVKKTARGAESIVANSRLTILELEQVANSGVPIIAMETGGESVYDFSFPKKGVLVVGSEELGVSPKVLEIAKSSGGIVTVPMVGVKGSLNVSTAFGVVLSRWLESFIR